MSARSRVGDEPCERAWRSCRARDRRADPAESPGLREAEPWTSREVTTAAGVPGSLLVLGGGVVGVEMAQAYASLGSAVRLLEGGERLIGAEEEFASRELREALERDGVDVLLAAKAVAVERAANAGPVTVELEDGRRFAAEQLLVCVGRSPARNSSGSSRSGSPAAAPSRCRTRCRCPLIRGCTWSATPTGACC